MSDFLRLLLVMLGSIPSVVWAALAGAAVGAIGTAVGSAVTGHYGMKREQEATAARLTEWTRDRAYEALADIDATHRMASLDHARLANKAKNEVSGLRQDEMGEHFELSIKFTNAAARAILLTPNLEVRKLIEQLEDETHDVAELIHQYRYTDNPARYDFLKRLFTIEGVDLSARRAPGRGRGLPRMKVPTRLIWKTSTCPTLLPRTASAVLT